MSLWVTRFVSSHLPYGTAVLGVFMLVLALAACGGQQQPPAQPEAAPPPAVDATTSPGFEVPLEDASETEAGEDTATEPVVDADALMSGLHGVDLNGSAEDMGPEELEAARERLLAELELDSALLQMEAGEEVMLPEDFPSDIRLPEDLTLQAAARTDEGVLILQAASEKSTDQLLTHFLQSMHGDGWTAEQQFDDGGRFERMHVLVFSKEDRVANINIIRSDRLEGQQITLTITPQ